MANKDGFLYDLCLCLLRGISNAIIQKKTKKKTNKQTKKNKNKKQNKNKRFNIWCIVFYKVEKKKI